MRITELFHKKVTEPLTYDHMRLEPAIRCSICTGEQVAGFCDRHTGRFEEITLIKTDADLDAFRQKYGIQGEIRRFY